MTIDDAIRAAGAWQERADVPGPEECQRMAHAFSFALVYLELERGVALDRLAGAGFSSGPLNQRVEAAIKEAVSGRS